jgi:hypothetical protein
MDTEQQLVAWSSQGENHSAQRTLETYRRILAASSTLRFKDFEVYLQGAYQNDTNTNGSNADIDIVVQLNQAFFGDTQQLNHEQATLYNNTYPNDAKYAYDRFWVEAIHSIIRLLDASTLTCGDKSVNIYNGEDQTSTNVVIALQYRKYKSFFGEKKQSYTLGTKFFSPRENSWIISYPKLHYVHGCVKNLANQTNGWYKPTVRVFKNIRNKLIEQGKITSNTTPSYFVECLLYNVPNDRFGVNWQTTRDNIINWLNKAEFEGFKCQNGQQLLFGDAPEQWNLQDAKTFVNALSEYNRH